MTKQRHLRTLISRVLPGHTPTMRYQGLSAAKRYAAQTGQTFPAAAQEELRRAARELLGEAIRFEQGHGRYV